VKVVVTGSSGHLGEALMRVLGVDGHDTVGIDIASSPDTTIVGSILDRDLVADAVEGADAVIHAATLHKPHVGTHSPQEFIDTNISGTLAVLEAASNARVSAVVYVSTTSTFGQSLHPRPGAPAVWITEEVPCRPKNIYGVTKTAAEDLCELFHRDRGLPVVILRTSRFFPEDDDSRGDDPIDSANAKVNELLHRRVDIADVVDACKRAVDSASPLGIGRYIVSATSPFEHEDVTALRSDPAAVIRRLCPDVDRIYGALGWRLPESIDRVYVNAKARSELGWEPVWDFGRALECLARGVEPRSRLAVEVGAKGYHDQPTVVYTTTPRRPS
jgi:UDP-glucose 4-epimerase